MQNKTFNESMLKYHLSNIFSSHEKFIPTRVLKFKFNFNDKSERIKIY